ncbi:MAG: glycosyltransferase family 4 protein, partial [Gaiellaceae bacterium]
FVFPTWYEAFPLVALEAAASGLPIVASSANGIDELLANGEAGIVAERTAEDVGQALARLVDDPDLRRSLGAAARDRSADYTWARSVDAVEAIYRSLTAARPAAGSEA